MCNIYLPPEFDVHLYKTIYNDLKNMSDEQLTSHFEKYGRTEGRRANSLINRKDFVSLISNDMKTLEIGPFNNPVIFGENVKYADYLSQTELIERAKICQRDSQQAPFIDYILSEMSLIDIKVDFDVVLSSHCIEHQPDFIQHLLDIQQLIKKKNGMYFLLVPDKRYCFDRFIKESTIADIMEAYMSRRRVHSLKSVIEHFALTTHNNSSEHWMTPAANNPTISVERVNKAIKKWQDSEGRYIDVHAWYFTPTSFYENVTLLHSMGIIELVVDKLYSTRRGKNEFWVVLKNA